MNHINIELNSNKTFEDSSDKTSLIYKSSSKIARARNNYEKIPLAKRLPLIKEALSIQNSHELLAFAKFHDIELRKLRRWIKEARVKGLPNKIKPGKQPADETMDNHLINLLMESDFKMAEKEIKSIAMQICRNPNLKFSNGWIRKLKERAKLRQSMAKGIECAPLTLEPEPEAKDSPIFENSESESRFDSISTIESKKEISEGILFEEEYKNDESEFGFFEPYIYKDYSEMLENSLELELCSYSY